ncbi:hypothetical protein RB195_016029 [Necator americanus]|uniref:BPTI/Kunitz inhibitor domain-containing protein n=1 Tax=Necator americanus TaxID=51031 RepID=A0ABR1E7M5_NECAM
MRCLLLVLLCITASENFFIEIPREMICSSPTHLPGIQCLAYFERYTYNREKNICEMFVYGGCRPSLNNFQTIEKCEETCVR